EDDLLDRVGVAVDLAGHLRVERRLFGERPEARGDLLPHVGDVGRGVGRGLEGGPGLVAALLGGPHLPDEVFLHHPRGPVERRRRGRGGLVCGDERRGEAERGQGGDGEQIAAGEDGFGRGHGTGLGRGTGGCGRVYRGRGRWVTTCRPDRPAVVRG